MIDPATRTTPVRIVTREPGGLLKKDLFVDVTIHDKSITRRAGRADGAVLYDEQNFPFVYVQVEPGKFAQRQVTIGAQQQRPDRDRSTASRRATRSWRRAASSFSSPTASKDRRADDRPHRLVRPLAALHGRRRDAGPGDLGRHLVPEPADRRVSGSGAAARPDRHAVAGPCRRGSRAADHHPARSRDERHPEARGAALDLALRAVVDHDELRVRHRPVLRARSRRSSASRTPKCPTAWRRACRRSSARAA